MEEEKKEIIDDTSEIIDENQIIEEKPVEKEETNSSKNHIKTTELYFEYCNLCVNNGISPLSNKVFAMKLSTYCKKNKIIKQKINNINGYYCKINR